jgi:hypothetical protein
MLPAEKIKLYKEPFHFPPPLMGRVNVGVKQEGGLYEFLGY